MKNENKQAIRIKERKLKVEEYQALRAQTDWDQIEDDAVQTALKNDLYSIVVLDGNDVVAIGRVIGDGAIYFYVQDVIVHELYRKMGLGNLVMEHIERFLKASARDNSFVGLMAAQGTQKFYEKFGYRKREDTDPGMFKIVKRLNTN